MKIPTFHQSDALIGSTTPRLVAWSRMTMSSFWLTQQRASHGWLSDGFSGSASEANSGASTKVLLEKDKKNAFNIVNRHKMLLACQEHLPGLLVSLSGAMAGLLICIGRML